MQKEKILDLISKQSLGVISTIDANGQPESALIGIGQTDKLELIFGTSNTSRKYQNLKRQPYVSFVIGWDKAITIQYEGIARELESEEAEHYAEIYYAKNPSSRRFKDLPDERYFIVTPKWIRYSDLGHQPNEIFEINL